jgi:hypothetical protein
MPELRTHADDGTELIATAAGYGMLIEPTYVEHLREYGYRITEVHEVHAVESSRGGAHLVVHVTVDDTPLWVCSCEGFRYNASADVSDRDVSPADCGECRHIEQAHPKHERASDDNRQLGLDVVGGDDGGE